jgi:transcriptional regulator with XRE-family HTH domain
VWINPEEHRIVGAVLSDFRKQAGLRQQDVAVRLGKPQSFVSSYEAGQRRIDVLELTRITACLGADTLEVVAEILKRQGSHPNGRAL